MSEERTEYDLYNEQYQRMKAKENEHFNEVRDERDDLRVRVRELEAEVERLKAALSAAERFRTEDAQDHIEETAGWRQKALYAEQMMGIHKHNSDKFSKALDEEREARYDLGADPEPAP